MITGAFWQGGNCGQEAGSHFTQRTLPCIQDEKQIQAQSRRRDFLFKIDSEPPDESVTALGGVPRLARGSGVLPTGNRPCVCCSCRRPVEGGPREGKTECKARGRGGLSANLCGGAITAHRRSYPGDPAPLNDPRLPSGSFQLPRIAVSNPFQILTDGLRMRASSPRSPRL